MLFNSWDFAVFFALVYAAYLGLARSFRAQNLLILVASYYFYAAWDWRFLALLLSSTLLDYFCALAIDSTESPGRRRAFLLASVAGNLTLLGFFKYFNFFLSSLELVLARFGVSVETLHLNVVLPVGISFYTFQEMSYTIDVYRREIHATKKFVDFAVFVAFFPHMVAGPIMRAKDLLTQFFRPRAITFERFGEGCWLILWGGWKKVFVADNMALLADPIFNHSADVTLARAYLGVVAFAFQIYADFSAYSDIARGVAKLMGFELIQNFNLPYFALNPSDFWRRWHISLSSWLRDYLYIPLGGNRKGRRRTYYNLFVTMFLGGLWHGAAWNYVWWGLYHGGLLSVQRWWQEWRGERASRPRHSILAMAGMFHLTLFGWLLFRCTRQTIVNGRTVDGSFAQIGEMLTSYRNGLGLDATSWSLLFAIVAIALPLLIVQVAQFRSGDQLVVLSWRAPVRAAATAVVLVTWLVWGVQQGTAFIYFQF